MLFQQQADSEIVHAGVVGYACELSHLFLHQGSNAILRNATESKPTQHEHRAILNIGNGGAGISNHFIHIRTLVR